MAKTRGDLLKEKGALDIKKEKVGNPEIGLSCYHCVAGDCAEDSVLIVDTIQEHVQIGHDAPTLPACFKNKFTKILVKTVNLFLGRRWHRRSTIIGSANLDAGCRQIEAATSILAKLPEFLV